MATKKELQARAKELGVEFVTRDSVEVLRTKIEAAEAKTAKRKATRKAKGKAASGDNADVLRLIEAVGTGDFALALEEASLSPGGLARQLGVEGAVVAKLASGKRTPRTTAPVDSIAGRVAAWFVEQTEAKRAAS